MGDNLSDIIKTRVHIVKCAESDYQKLTYKNPLCMYITNATGDFTGQDPTETANIYIGAYLVRSGVIINGGGQVMENTISKYIIQSTGGNLDLQSGDAVLMSIKGTLDASCNPFIADTFNSTEMNLVNPDQYITINGHKAYYFIVEKGVMGTVGSTNQNNGYIIINGNVAGVYYNAQKPTAAAYGTECSFTNDGNEVRHYTPSAAGWLTILTNDDIAPACHLIWSGRHNDEAGVYGLYTKAILAAIQAVHSYGLSGLLGPYDSSYDEIDFVKGKGYPRNDRVALSDLTWVMSDVTVDNHSAKAFTATISAMKSGGLYATNYADPDTTLSVSGNTLTITSESVTSLEALMTSLGASVLYYQKATVTPVNISVSSSIKVNDMGLEYFTYNGELAPVPAIVSESYYLGINDQILNAIAEIANISRIVAEALVGLRADVDSVNVDNQGNAHIKSIDLDELPKICGFPLIKFGPSNPSVNPDFVPQFYQEVEINPTTGKPTFGNFYKANGVLSPSDWQRINN